MAFDSSFFYVSTFLYAACCHAWCFWSSPLTLLYLHHRHSNFYLKNMFVRRDVGAVLGSSSSVAGSNLLHQVVTLSRKVFGHRWSSSSCFQLPTGYLLSFFGTNWKFNCKRNQNTTNPTQTAQPVDWLFTCRHLFGFSFIDLRCIPRHILSNAW
jgi:hypothetical protein